ncbi:MAG: cysteine--tRNA ligase [Hahellaceae bacterium]|nr:cysteine--tRNA ligase [Hahellaceae bacterium]
MIQIYNSLTQKKEVFVPLEEGKVKMYVCGMTVYDYCHLGHARVLVAFDVITRHLRHRGYDVNYIRNITDVDDKIFNRAAERGIPFDALTEQFINAMHEDERALGVLAPNAEPRATQHIAEIIAMIARLIQNGYAYAAENGDVYYEIAKYAPYGQLSKKKVEDLIAGARVEIGESKRSPVDFTLWKAAKEGEACWDSPWGKGRPGWHIECSAMSTCCLGNTFDIHGGGPDLKFPHHENEIAQSEGATGQKYVNTWMHAGAIRVNKEKMSKSLGNFFTIREILEKYPAEVVRFFLISSQYRSQVDYSEDALQEAKASLDRFYNAMLGVEVMSGEVEGDYRERFLAAMDDDFNTPEAIAVLFELAREINRCKASDKVVAGALVAELRALGDMLGVLQQDPTTYIQAGSGKGEGLQAEEIEALIVQRKDARANKNFAESDRIRDYLKQEGIELDDRKEGTTWRRV